MMTETEKESKLEERRRSRKDAKDRAASRLKLIKALLYQKRTTRDINDVRSDKIGAWNYELSADSDIHKRCCPLCFQAYSDFELTAVVPCWHCRDKIPLSQAIAIGASVSMPIEESNPLEIEVSDDVMIHYLLDRIQQLENNRKSILREAREISKYEQPHTANALKRNAEKLAAECSQRGKDLKKRLRLTRAGREEEFFEDVLEKSRKKQRKLSPAKVRQNRVHAQGRRDRLFYMLKGYCGDTYMLWIKQYPMQIYCNDCGVACELDVAPEKAASKSVESIVSSLEVRKQIYEFIKLHSEHTNKRIPEDILTTSAGGW